MQFPFVGYHTLYEWYRSMESEHFPDPTGLRARLEQWTLGLYPACIKYLMSAFDVPEVIRLSAIAAVYLSSHFFEEWICICSLKCDLLKRKYEQDIITRIVTSQGHIFTY